MFFKFFCREKRQQQDQSSPQQPPQHANASQTPPDTTRSSQDMSPQTVSSPPRQLWCHPALVGQLCYRGRSDRRSHLITTSYSRWTQGCLRHADRQSLTLIVPLHVNIMMMSRDVDWSFESKVGIRTNWVSTQTFMDGSHPRGRPQRNALNVYPENLPNLHYLLKFSCSFVILLDYV